MGIFVDISPIPSSHSSDSHGAFNKVSILHAGRVLGWDWRRENNVASARLCRVGYRIILRGIPTMIPHRSLILKGRV